jgi:hypothetical protein
MSEGTEANQINAASVLGPGLAIFPGSAAALEIAGPTSRWPFAFALEGLPLDRCVTLNCGIRDKACC